MPRPWDVAVIGAGVVGCATARALALRGKRVLVLEKEPGPALHQSGRNSGVIHAGFSYVPGSLKARFSVQGAAMLKAYCSERGVPWREVGKLVAATKETEVPELERLRVQGETNGVRGLRVLDEKELREVEPQAAGLAALHSPQSGILDAPRYVQALAEDARVAGVEFHYSAALRGAQRTEGHWWLRTRDAVHEAETVVTCAGLQSDRLASLFKVQAPGRIVPFRGEFHRLAPGREKLVRGLLYPVPDKRFPFVGVHFTKRPDGGVLVGPTALLALGREAYRSKLQPNARDLASMGSFAGFWRMLGRADIRAHARREAKQAALPRAYLRAAQALLPALRAGDVVRSHSGIRAQMVSPMGQFIDDLLLAEQPGAVHVLNAVSPGLTSSLPFAEHVAERVEAAAEGAVDHRVPGGPGSAPGSAPGAGQGPGPGTWG